MRPGLSKSRFHELIRWFGDKRVLVAGDLMLDEFIWGRVSRISPEAPVPVVNVTSETWYPGGAANVARNLREFTEHIAVVGVIGSDGPGHRLRALLDQAGIDTAGVLEDPSAPTTVKTRVIARNQQVVRVDRDRNAALNPAQVAPILAYLERTVPGVDAIIAADYGKGFFAQPLADALCRLSRKHAKILTVDPHPHTSLVWRGATAVKPNRSEAFHAAGIPDSEDEAALLQAARRLLGLWHPESLLITLGEQGMWLFDGNAEPLRLPARAHEVFDVSGAGDTAIAVLTLALASGATPTEAAELANRASGIVVGKIGTATVTSEELLRICATG